MRTRAPSLVGGLAAVGASCLSQNVRPDRRLKKDDEGGCVDLHSISSLISHALSFLPECFPSVLLYLVLRTLTLVGGEVKSWGRMRKEMWGGLVSMGRLSQANTWMDKVWKSSHRPHWRWEQCGGSAGWRDPPQMDTPPVSMSWTHQPAVPAPQISKKQNHT